jgi:hypothetical protein
MVVMTGREIDCSFRRNASQVLQLANSIVAHTLQEVFGWARYLIGPSLQRKELSTKFGGPENDRFAFVESLSGGS